jgi:flavorubredoxin
LKILVAYFSMMGHTKEMAEYVAEGIRVGGHEAKLASVSELKDVQALEGYDGYVLGSPTFHLDMAGPMKTFLFLMRHAKLVGKMGGAFGSYTHTGNAPGMIFDTMEHVFKMKMTNLGSFNLIEARVSTEEGRKACQDYGRVLAEQAA